MVAGTIIGSSIFVQPSEIARYLDTPLQIMLVWAACGVLTLFGAMVCAELASAFPQTGGVYVFLRDTCAPIAGFAIDRVGWQGGLWLPAALGLLVAGLGLTVTRRRGARPELTSQPRALQNAQL